MKIKKKKGEKSQDTAKVEKETSGGEIEKKDPLQQTLKAVMAKLEEAYGARQELLDKAKMGVRTNLGRKTTLGRLILCIEAINDANYALGKDLVNLAGRIAVLSSDFQGAQTHLRAIDMALKAKGILTDEDLENSYKELMEQFNKATEEAKKDGKE